MQAMRHRGASTSRVAGIYCERSEYYACEKYAGEKNGNSRGRNFRKF